MHTHIYTHTHTGCTSPAPTQDPICNCQERAEHQGHRFLATRSCSLWAGPPWSAGSLCRSQLDKYLTPTSAAWAQCCLPSVASSWGAQLFHRAWFHSSSAAARPLLTQINKTHQPGRPACNRTPRWLYQSSRENPVPEGTQGTYKSTPGLFPEGLHSPPGRLFS